jgi:hypothetical protein
MNVTNSIYWNAKYIQNKDAAYVSPLASEKVEKNAKLKKRSKVTQISSLKAISIFFSPFLKVG